MRVSNWQSIRTRISPHQLLVGLNTFSKQQLVAIKNMGFGSIMKLKTDSLPAKMSHFVVDNFSRKDMAIKLTVGNIEVNETVISELLGLRNSGAVIEYKKKEKKKDKENEEQKEHKDEQKGKNNDKNSGFDIESDVKEDEDEEEEDEEVGILAEWKNLYKGRTITPSRIVDRLRDNPTEDGMMFKYDFLTLFMNTMVEINKDGRCKIDFLKCLGEDVAVEDVNWCKYICDSMKMSKDGWQRDSTSKYFNGALTILVMLYVDRTLCGDINTVRISSPLSFWTKEMLSRRQTWEIKNGGFGKGALREGYVDTQVDVEHETKEDRMKKVEQMVDKNEGEKKNVTFEEHVRMVESLMAETLSKKKLLNKELDDICYKYPKNEKVEELVREYDRTFRGENKMSVLLSTKEMGDSKENKVMAREKDKKVNVKIKGGMKVFTRSRKRSLKDEGDVLDGVSKNDECGATKVDGVTQNDGDIKLDKVIGETIKWAETEKSVMKR
ncbi:hypothetical protein HanXRQr2_Chr07g0291191 [Helianthus annuus]|uniref:Ulp1 protease family, C-terminal catalytic domain-containing protein n=3 Tax=Helianthus annuus TaxID=4232 RepID=A0A9K3IJW3_HELAN|nr:hypothetical protein HanXRQr2_Chr07g0291191 [Helianthus annuus]KAJ0904416.1 hypothetical protein HanPSC8_Chr07g0281921 [Helianthus annuus]